MKKCPQCGSDNIIKGHVPGDPNATATCMNCDWIGRLDEPAPEEVVEDMGIQP